MTKLYVRLLFIIGLMAHQVWAADVVSEMSIRSDYFSSPDYSATQERSFYFLGAHFANISSSQDGKVSGLQGDVYGLFAPQVSALSYLDVRELYIANNEFYFGRKKTNWNFLDQLWQRGLFEPQFRWNPLTPQRQGLTGLFFIGGDGAQAKTDYPVTVKLFASFLYIPDQGAGYQMKGGQFEATNPWFPQMPSHVQFDNEGRVVNPINWNINKPEMNEIVFNSSYATSVSIGRPLQGFFAQASLAHKPSNQLVLGGDVYVPPNGTIAANVQPKIFYHTLAGIDLSYMVEQFRFGLSVVSEKPKTPDFSSDVTYAIYSDSVLTAPFVELRLKDFNVLLTYLDVQGGQESIVGPKASQFAGILPKRFDYLNATKLKLGWSLKRVLIESAYTQGSSSDFALWQTSASYKATNSWTFMAQTLFVRSGAKQDAPLFAEFGSNDSFSLGASYAF